MKAIKRVIVITVLIVVGLLVGCFAYTGNRLKTYPDEISAFADSTYVGDDIMASFNGESELVYVVGETVLVLDVTEYSGGVIYATSGENTYRFTVVDNMLYDEQTQEFLTRRGADG